MNPAQQDMIVPAMWLVCVLLLLHGSDSKHRSLFRLQRFTASCVSFRKDYLVCVLHIFLPYIDRAASDALDLMFHKFSADIVEIMLVNAFQKSNCN